MLHSIFNFKAYDYKSFKYQIIIIVLILGSIGMFLINIMQDSDENMFEKQILGYAVGIIAMLMVSFIDYHFICKLWIPLYIFNLALLLFCKFTDKSMGLPIYGYKHYTAKRWIRVGSSGFEFMPSELTKIILIVFLAEYFALTQRYIKKFLNLVIITLLTAIPIYLVFDQPDLSTTIILLSFFAFVVLAAGVSFKIIIPIILIGVPVICGFIWYVMQPWVHILEDYQKGRILSLIYPELYADEMYQQDNAAAAIRSGGLLGKLFTGDTSQRGWAYVPVKESDFIFSAIGEEFGMIGCFIVIGLYVTIVIMGIRIAKKAMDIKGTLIAVGITSLFGMQAFVNIGVVTSLLPNTGIPLPFVSSGLSALLSNLATVGILLNVSMQPKNRKMPLPEEDIVKKTKIFY